MPPIALLAASFAVGIALRETARLPAAACGAGVVAATVVLLGAWRGRRWLGVVSLAHALALGTLAAALAWPRAPVGLLDGAPWDVTARVVEEPERAFGRTHLLLELEEVARGGRARAASGRVRLAFDGDPPELLLPGDRVRFRARLAEPHGFVEPAAPDPARRYAEREVIAVAGLAEARALARLLPSPAASSPCAASSCLGTSLGACVRDAASSDASVASCLRDAALRSVARLRRFLLARVAAHLAGERRALVESLVLGERGGVPRDLDDAFRAAGVNHVLSVSGLHLALAAFLLLVGLRRLLVRLTPIARRIAVHRIAAAAALPATLLYTLLTGSAVATVRSLVVAWVFLVGTVIGRPALALAAFGAAALALLFASPLALYDPSFQLSFAAALGAALLAPAALAAVRRSFLDGKSLAARAARFALALLFTSAAAIAATAPLTAWHFAQVAPAGLVANLVVVPLAELWVLPAGLAGCALAPLADGAAGLLLRLAGVGAGAMAAATRAFAAWFPAGKLRAPTLIEALLWYGLVACVLVALRGRRRPGLAGAAACALGLALAVGWSVARPRLFPALTVTFLDVGQGDACLVELPDGRTLLVDGGGALTDGDRFDPGAQVLVPWLERRGVRRIDYVVLTHPHPDHVNGLGAVVERFPVGEVWTNGATSALPGLARLEAAAALRASPVVRPHALDGPAKLEVLHPLVGGAVRVPPDYAENDGSLVLRLRYGGRAVLLTGDVERRAESRLVGGLEHPGHLAALAADVVKAPHHGSRTSSNPGFVEAVQPQLVVFSAGAGNRWGFPASEVVARWRDAGARTLRTDEDGAVTVRIAAAGSISVETARRR